MATESTMAKPKLCLTRRLPQAVMTAIAERFSLTTEPAAAMMRREAFLAGVRTAEAILCTLTDRMDAEVLQQAPQARVVANYAVGYNNIDLDAAKARRVVVTNTPDILTEATADLTWALLLATARRIPEGHALVQTGAWEGWEPTQLLGWDVHGSTLGIIGMGRIGRAVARRARGFNMPVLYCRRPVPGRPRQTCEDNQMWTEVPLDDLLARADFISLHVPLTPETRHMIGAAQLGRIRPSACLINTSRGPVLDEAALVEALRAGTLGGAGLDVYEHEPSLNPGLYGLRQVVTAPHLGSATSSARVRMGLTCIENIVAVLEGRPAPNRVA